MDAVFYQALVEIYDESEVEMEQAQVGESLRFEHGIVGDARLALDDDTLVDQQIEAKIGGQPLALVHERHDLLAVNRHPSRLELEGERLLVHSLQQPWPSQGAMNLDSRLDDNLTDLILRHPLSPFAPLRLCAFAPLR